MASSLVAKYIATKVPTVMYLFTYSIVAITEKPHCGIEARKLPINGPNFCELRDKFSIFSEK